MSLTSVKTRFFLSVGVNILRAIISLLTGLLVARGLSPASYGDLSYLLGSFLAIKALMDMGSGSAFYTFISQRVRGRTLYLIYYTWLLIQFLVTVLLVTVLLPQSLIDRIWVGHSREIILLAFLASFMQQQVWATVTQLGESTRQTVKVQLLGLAVIATHALVVLALYFGDWLSVTAVLIAIIGEYLFAAMVSGKLLRASHSAAEIHEPGTRELLLEYWRFCRPLMLLAMTSFLYEFADRWILQTFAGSIQQGFYQISAQLAAVSLLATSSILNIFWKEISEANACQDKSRVAYLYKKVSRGLFMLGAVMSCFMIPWAEEIVTFLLGANYQKSWVVFAVMLIYPIHQSMGQVNGTMFLACAHTKVYTFIAMIGQAISIPISYFLMATPTNILIPGLGLGALGLAIKMVGMNILLVNIQGGIIARINGWKYDWSYQLVGIAWALALGFLVKIVVCFFLPISVVLAYKINFLLALTLSGGLYLLGVAALLWLYPQIAGIDKSELQSFVAKYIPFRLQ